MIILAALLAVAQPGTFRPVVALPDIQKAIDVCRSAPTVTGLDAAVIQRAGFETGDSIEPGQPFAIWHRQDAFILLSTRTWEGKVSCNVGAQVRDQQSIRHILGTLPLPGKPADPSTGWIAEDQGQQIKVAATDSQNYPTINITFSRQMEPNAQ